MFNNRSSLFKFSFLVLFLGLSTGFLFNYYAGNTKGGFVSPVVFGKEVSSKAKNSSPFSALFDKLVPQPNQTHLSPANTLSYKGTGAVLGEKTASGSVQDSESLIQSSNNSSSGSSNSTNTSSTASTTTSTTTTASNTPSSQTSTDNATTTTLTNTQQAVEDVTNVVVSYLKSANYTALYNLMSADFKNTFSLEDFVSSFSGSPTISVSTVTSTPKIYGASNEWSEQSVRFSLYDGSVQNYLNIYHLEGTGTNSAWTLFATQDQ